MRKIAKRLSDLSDSAKSLEIAKRFGKSTGNRLAIQAISDLEIVWNHLKSLEILVKSLDMSSDWGPKLTKSGPNGSGSVKSSGCH